MRPAFADTTLPLQVQEQAQQWRFSPTSSGSVKIFYPLLDCCVLGQMLT
jgi:hypothetical protein